MYVLSWRTVSALTGVLFWCLFLYEFILVYIFICNKHQNNPLVSAETIRHSSTYIIIYIYEYIMALQYATQTSIYNIK